MCEILFCSLFFLKCIIFNNVYICMCLYVGMCTLVLLPAEA